MSELVTLPGFVDLHVYFREPGDNTAETIENGTQAALLGGYVQVYDMPNNPGNPTWTVARLDEKIGIARGSAYAKHCWRRRDDVLSRIRGLEKGY